MNAFARSTDPAPPPAPNAGEALIEAIAEAVMRKLERWSVTRQRLMEIEAAAEYLGMSPSALREKAGRIIPCVRFDGRLRFDKRELDRWIDRAPREGV